MQILTATLNFYVKFTFYQQATVKKLEIVRKQVVLRSAEKKKAEIALLPRHAAPVAQWTSVLDF